MKHQKDYNFLQKQILLMIGLSLIPGFIYVILGWFFTGLLPAALWYGGLILVSLYGFSLYKKFNSKKMTKSELAAWYKHLTYFMYIIFSSWSVIFVLNIGYHEHNLHYIAIFTQLGASVTASTLLVSDRRMFVPILLTLMLPLSLYFLFLDTWFGYVLTIFSLIFVSVLLYAANNTNRLIQNNYYQAQHDILTGLFNRRYFMEYIESMSERLMNTKKVVYMLLIDLDHFKTINDSLGHDIGDKLLQEVSKRIDAFSKETHVLARLGGDEFVLVSQEIEEKDYSDEDAYAFAMNLLSVIRAQYTIDGHNLHISASIGLHEITHFSLDTKNFIREVDIAMYEAKSQGRDGVIVFNKDLSKKVERHLVIEQKLHQTLHGNKLHVYYQPQFNRSQEMVGCEALVRWFDDELGTLAPDEFIPIAESTGLILELGSYVLHETFRNLHAWNEKGVFIEYFSINISIRQMIDETFLEEVEVMYAYYFAKLKENQTIVFEITEHVFAENMALAVRNMNRLKDIGIIFSIDDFGTGYSALNYLQELPVSEVKIDKSFVAEMDKSKNSKNMIATIISIAKNFNLTIVAEGIETEEQLEILKALECDTFQGFYFDQALAHDAFEQKYLGLSPIA
ncbi:MAG: EAL domain-containing protein [Sulfurovum sp.]|nr:EAL domain-containing protein [Sulfurovum sp.]